MGRGQFFVRNFFFCKSYNLEFFWILFFDIFITFYALRRSLANFQDYIAPSGQTLFQTAWRKVPKMKKGQEKPKFVKKWVRQKRAYQVANFFLLKSFIVSWSKSLKSFRLIAFMVLERLLGVMSNPQPLLLFFPPIHRGYTQRPYGIGLKIFFIIILFRISKYCQRQFLNSECAK